MGIDITNDELFKSHRDYDHVEEISVIDDGSSSISSNALKPSVPMQNPKSIENSEN